MRQICLFLLHVHAKAVRENSGATLSLLGLSSHVHDADEGERLTVRPFSETQEIVFS